MNPAEQAVLQHALQRGYLSPQHLDQARAEQARTGAPLLSILRERHLSPEQVSELGRIYSATHASSSDSERTIASSSGSRRSTTSFRSSDESRVRPGEPGFAGQIGPYVVEHELARGGMGVVYVARHAQLDRRVALKLILSSIGGDGTEVERFGIEAQAVGRLAHPGIVKLHDVGRSDLGHPYIAMELVEGMALDRKLKTEGAMDPRLAAGLVEDMARAMQHAHENGVLHRDLKPANVLLDAEGRPRITDFGLARTLESVERLTQTGQLLGTPSYMPPEQAEGRAKDVDARADVYSLGATLYALLTGRPPFQGETAMNVVSKLLTTEAPAPSSIRPGIPADLEAIVFKCLEKVPGDRYRTAGELAEDLARFSFKRPVKAERRTALVRARRWVQRHPALIAACAIFALVMGSAGIYVRLTEDRPEQQSASQVVAQLVEEGQHRAARGAFDAAHRKFAKARELDPGNPLPHLASASVFVSEEKWEEALRACGLASDLGAPADAAFLLTRARARVGLERFEDAVQDLDAAASAASPASSREVLELRSSVHRRLGNLGQAATDFAATLEAERTPQRVARAAHLHSLAGDLQAARGLLEEVAREEPDQVAHPLALAWVLYRLRERDAAEALCDDLLERFDRELDKASILLMRARIVLGLGGFRLKQVSEDLDLAIQKNSDLSEAYAYRAYYRFAVMQSGSVSDATVDDALAAVQKGGGSMAQAVFSEVALRKRDRARAEGWPDPAASLRRALDCEEPAAHAHTLMAERYLSSKDLDLAEAEVGRALAIDPYWFEAHLASAQVSFRKQTADGDRACLEECAYLFKHWSMLKTPYLLQIRLHRRSGDHANHIKAIEFYMDMIQGKPLAGEDEGARERELRPLIEQRAEALAALNGNPGGASGPSDQPAETEDEPEDSTPETETETKPETNSSTPRRPRMRLRPDALRKLVSSPKEARPIEDWVLYRHDSPPVRFLRRGKARFALKRYEEARADLRIFLRGTRSPEPSRGVRAVNREEAERLLKEIEEAIGPGGAQPPPKAP